MGDCRIFRKSEGVFPVSWRKVREKAELLEKPHETAISVMDSEGSARSVFE